MKQKVRARMGDRKVLDVPDRGPSGSRKGIVAMRKSDKSDTSEAMPADAATIKETRTQRRRRRNRVALLNITEQIMEEKGCDATTVQEIADRTDVALGTFCSFFNSKDDVIIVAMDAIMTRMRRRIRRVTDGFADPGQAFDYGVHVVMETATSDPSWNWLLRRRPGAFADAIVRAFGPYAIADIRRAVKAKRYNVDDIDLGYRQAIWAKVATCLAITTDERKDLGVQNLLEQATANILCMTGVNRKTARGEATMDISASSRIRRSRA